MNIPISTTRSTSNKIKNIGVKPYLTVLTINITSITGAAIVKIAITIAIKIYSPLDFVLELEHI
jgi:hypothetical protein